ncbi:uncharacterized protein [Phaseolus vulgaris]|uniref:uncharacterized protein n=1 Tax=Phaseolus vulgaris TaxID=3885 RepID=UPI0035CAFC68
MKKVLPTIIDESQSAFLKGRGILDSVLMANEVVEDIRKKGRSDICLKVDFEKAYDSVRWDFLYDMLHRMGFHNVWISWIRGCLESAIVSLLVNGSTTEEFKPSRGLRQGDPLAHFLFIVVAEGLAGLVRQALKANMLTGLKIGRQEVEMCILQFADDTLFLCEDTIDNVVTLKAILRGFELASGLRINFHKSRLAGINVQSNVVVCFTKILNYIQMEVPFKYLGLEVGGNPRKKQFWEPVLNKLKARLSAWKGRAPVSVCKRIISIQTRFLWDWGKLSKPIAWASWKDVCRPKEEGGLGCRNIRLFNQALLAKWRWRCVSEEKGRWKTLLESKYNLGIDSSQTPVKSQSWWWRDLSKMCKEGGGKGWFQEELGWEIGYGDKVKFSEEVWVGSVDLKSLFPRLYSLSLNQGQTVGELGEWIDSEWRWRMRWKRDRFEWESSLERDLIALLSGVTLKKNVQDIQVWGKEVPGLFSVNSAYECLAKHDRGNQSEVYKLLWKVKAFPNVVVTAWRERGDVELNGVPFVSVRGGDLSTSLFGVSSCPTGLVSMIEFPWGMREYIWTAGICGAVTRFEVKESVVEVAAASGVVSRTPGVAAAEWMAMNIRACVAAGWNGKNFRCWRWIVDKERRGGHFVKGNGIKEKGFATQWLSLLSHNYVVDVYGLGYS